LAPCVSLLGGRDPSAPTSFLYVPRLRIAIRYDFRHCGRGVPAANGTGVHRRSRAITNADHAPATSARSRLPWALERVIALPFKEGELTAMGPCHAMPSLSKGQRKELKAMRLPAPQLPWPLSNTWSNPTNHRLVPYGHKPELRSSSTFTSHA
jgi:hypothetical protein